MQPSAIDGGSDPPFRLLESNMVDLFDDIPLAKLDQKFQDAIEATWAPGLVYLWIDTLCIIQDSQSDWEAQSSDMGATYKNAFCNIAAANTNDSAKGLFATRDPYQHFSPHVFIDWETVNAVDGRVHPRGYYCLRNLRHWAADVDTAPVNQRGWVSQERELSPCTLIFTGQQLYWRCSELRACEAFPTGVPYVDHVVETQRLFKASLSFRAMTMAKPEPDSVISFWHEFIARYSKSELTQKRDRLPAAFGMACELSSLMPGNRFLAGLWESHLAKGLLWSAIDRAGETQSTPGK